MDVSIQLKSNQGGEWIREASALYQTLMALPDEERAAKIEEINEHVADMGSERKERESTDKSIAMKKLLKSIVKLVRTDSNMLTLLLTPT